MSGSTSILKSPAAKADIDMNTLLCFACSASLPPPKKYHPGSASPPILFTTLCCQRIICSNCITENPRLQRYNPCLACLGGVGVVRSPPFDSPPGWTPSPNFNGAMRDEDVFVLGDGDNSDYEDEKEGDPSVSSPIVDAPLINAQGTLPSERPLTEPAVEEAKEARATECSPLKYHIAQSDTLQGIVLRFGLDGHELCRLNNLPRSTLRTTPHLLHTRRYLILPPSVCKAGITANKETAEQVAVWEASRGKERAEKRLQTLTKEVDWRIAKAYVALADDPVEQVEEQEEWKRKRKETGSDGGSRPSTLDERAIRRYLDDNEWEENQRRGGAKAGSSEKANNSWW